MLHIRTHTEETEGEPVPIFPCDNVPGCNNIYLTIKQLSEHKKAHGAKTLPGVLDNLKTYMEFYYNQSNMVHDDQKTMMSHIISSLSSLDTALNIFTGEIRKELESIVQKLGDCSWQQHSHVSKGPVSLTSSPSPSTTRPKILIAGTSLNKTLYREVVELSLIHI